MSSAFDDALSPREVRDLLAAPAVLQAMLDVEAALALAQADLGLIPAAHAPSIAQCCTLQGWPVDELLERSRSAGSLAIPLVAELTRRVRGIDASAVASVHWGATSQDLIDTALALQARRVMGLVQADLDRLLQAVLRLQERHGAAPMLARTLMQPASVIPFGARLLNWFEPLQRCRSRMAGQADRALRLQLAGAVGTGAAWGDQALPLAQAVARRLGLPHDAGAAAGWQTQRDELARLAAELGVLVGAVGKVAGDVALMAQAEVGEMQETAGAGRGGSSAMPHKRNPVGCMTALAAARRAPMRVAAVLECMAPQQERGLGNWQAEVAEFAELLTLAAAAVQAMADALDGATVDEARMLALIESQQGLPMAEALARHWAPRLGRDEAHHRVQSLSAQALAERTSLLEAARAWLWQQGPGAALPADDDELARLFDPQAAADVTAPNLAARWAAARAQWRPYP